MLESDELQQYRRTPQGPMLDPLEPALRKLPEDRPRNQGAAGDRDPAR
jgi:hypothetical protein